MPGANLLPINANSCRAFVVACKMAYTTSDVLRMCTNDDSSDAGSVTDNEEDNFSWSSSESEPGISAHFYWNFFLNNCKVFIINNFLIVRNNTSKK